MASITMPVIGSVTACRSALIGVAIWVIAMRNTSTSTSLETIRASRNAAHFPTHDRETSHADTENASGARLTTIRIHALLSNSENHTIATAAIISPARKKIGRAHV